MKLVRYGVAGHERPGVFIGEDIFDASILAADYDETFFANEGLERLKKAADEGLLKKVGADVRLGPPIARPSKLICVGLNYRDHAAETNAKIPAEPILFF
ncbi:MAG TPA: ureidoglycolate lyase, partial [Saprospiraceae bacterium]|nr:ureidoglycolate lyase [Saprospiraceae bacterium]